MSVCLADSKPVNSGIRKSGISAAEATYINIESELKHAEGKLWGTIMGPF